jgi:hypothetical protein
MGSPRDRAALAAAAGGEVTTIKGEAIRRLIDATARRRAKT